jgi:hypothetical protein
MHVAARLALAGLVAARAFAATLSLREGGYDGISQPTRALSRAPAGDVRNAACAHMPKPAPLTGDEALGGVTTWMQKRARSWRVGPGKCLTARPLSPCTHRL